MKIAVGTRNFRTIAGHAGRTRHWLLFEAGERAPLAAPRRIVLDDAQLIHHFGDRGAHPLDGTQVVITGSAGRGFFRHMEQRGARVLLTGEADPCAAVRKLLAGVPLAPTRFDLTTVLCKAHHLLARR